MELHKLKIKNKYYQDIYYGDKTFELRKDDRNYQVGDLIEFTIIDSVPETDEKNDKSVSIGVTANCLYKITYILKDVPEYGLDKDYCIFGIEKLDIRNY